MPRIELKPYKGKYPPLSIYFNQGNFPGFLGKEEIVFAYYSNKTKPPDEAANFNLVYEIGLALLPPSSELKKALIRGLEVCDSRVCEEYRRLLHNFNVPDYSWDSIPPNLIDSNIEAIKKVVEWAEGYYSQGKYINEFMERLLEKWDKDGDMYVAALETLLEIEIPPNELVLHLILLSVNDAYWSGIWGCDVAPWSRDSIEEAVDSEIRTVIEELIHILTFTYIFPKLKDAFQKVGVSYENAPFGSLVHSLKEAMIDVLDKEARRRGLPLKLTRPPAAKEFYSHLGPYIHCLDTAMRHKRNIVDALEEVILSSQ